MTGCCVPGCSGSSKKGQRLFRFPRDSGRRKAWECQVKRDGWRPNDNSKVCELHFDQNQYEANRQDGRRLLKQTAVPLLFDFRPHPQRKKPPHHQICPAPIVSDFIESSSPAQECASGDNNVSEDHQESVSDRAAERAGVPSVSSSAAQDCYSGNNDISKRHQEDTIDYAPGSADLSSLSSLVAQEYCSVSSDSDMSGEHQEGVSGCAAGSANIFSMSTSELVKEVLDLRKKNSVLQKRCSEANKKLKRELVKTKHLQKELSTVSSNLNILGKHIKVALQKASASSLPMRRAACRQKFL